MTGDDQTWALIAGGGTAGHVFPGLAVARALIERGHPPASLQFVGSQRGIEVELVPAGGFGLTVLPGRGIQRRLTRDNLGAVTGLTRAFITAVRLVGRTQPRVVVSLGGYASVPCALAAVVRRVPVVVTEQNAVPGAANRLVARFARASAVSFPGTPLPRAVVTGNPVRPEFAAVDRDRDRPAARLRFGVAPERALVLVFGGSLGALRINRAVLGAVERWRDRRDLTVRHIIGARDWDQITAESPELPRDGLEYQPVRYEVDMAGAMTAADLAVCRAGSSTCFELAAVGLPAIVVPSPHVTGDHQTANARHLAESGAAVVISDAELDSGRLADEVEALVADPDRLAVLSAAVRRLSRPDAADRVAELVEAHAR